MKKFSPRQIADAYGVHPDKVTGWIRSGELRAMNVSNRTGGTKPRYRVDQKDLDDFERRRSVLPATPTPKRRRKESDVTEFFPEE